MSSFKLDNDEKTLVQERNKIIQNYEYDTKQYYQLLYNLIFNLEKGPRLGSYIIFAGPNKIADHLETYL